MIRVVGCGYTLSKTGFICILVIEITGGIIIDVDLCTCRNSRGVYVRIIAADVHALDRGTGVLAFLQMDDKGVYLFGAICSRSFGVVVSIACVIEGIGIVVDCDFNTGCCSICSSKRFVVCGCKSQILTDLTLQLQSDTVVLNILRNFDMVNKIIRRPRIRHIGIKPPSCGVLIFFTGRGKVAGGAFTKAPAAVGRRNILSDCVILTVYLEGGIIMHHHRLASR